MKIGLTTKEILINQLINQLIDHFKNLKMKSFKSFKRVVKTSTLDAIGLQVAQPMGVRCSGRLRAARAAVRVAAARRRALPG